MLYYKKDPDRVVSWMKNLKRTETGQYLMNFGKWTHNKSWKKIFQNTD